MGRTVRPTIRPPYIGVGDDIPKALADGSHGSVGNAVLSAPRTLNPDGCSHLAWRLAPIPDARRPGHPREVCAVLGASGRAGPDHHAEYRPRTTDWCSLPEGNLEELVPRVPALLAGGLADGLDLWVIRVGVAVRPVPNIAKWEPQPELRDRRSPHVD